MISGSEVAFFSIDPTKLKTEKNLSSISKIKKLLNKPNYLLATILISNNLVKIAIIILSTYLTSILFECKKNILLILIIQLIIVTFLLLLIGEVMPKIYANQKKLSFIKKMSSPLILLNSLFRPLSQILVTTTSIIDKRFNTKGYKISIDNLSSELDFSVEKDTNEEEKRILRSIVEFGNIQVKEIMKSRVDVISLERNETFNNVKKLVISSGYSRIPVYKENFELEIVLKMK